MQMQMTFCNNYYKMSTYSYLFKYIIIGDTSVGKSCILFQFMEKKFKFDHDTTIGVQFGSKLIPIKSKQIKLQIWDTAGQQTFKSITRSYYRGSIGVVLVYDITNKQTFNSINKWVQEIKNYSNDKITLILVGNKTDLDFKRAVTFEEGEQMAKNHGMMFIECSAKSGQNVDELFNGLSEKIYSKIQSKELDPKNEAIGVKIGYLQHDVNVDPQQRKCC